MSDSNELRSRGLKTTQLRLQTLKIFQKAGTRNVTAEEVHRLLFKQGHKVGLAACITCLNRQTSKSPSISTVFTVFTASARRTCVGNTNFLTITRKTYEISF